MTRMILKIMNLKQIIPILIITLRIPFYIYAQENYIQLKAAIHIDSEISGGQYSIDQLGEMLQKERLDVGIITDHDNVEVEYGLFPLRKIIKYTETWPSIHTFGINNYLNVIDNVDRSSLNCLLLPGVEAVPCYRWQGNLLKRNLTLRDWHRHLLVFGLEKAVDYRNLPSLTTGFSKSFSMRSILTGFIYLFLFLSGTWFSFRGKQKNSTLKVHRQHSDVPYRNNSEIPVHYKFARRLNLPFKIGIAILAVIGMVGMIYNYPFKENHFSPYLNNDNPAPYQELIDYVVERNGLVFWAHPEANYEEKIKGIDIVTRPYPELLLQTQDYTGFAIFWEGMKQIGKPGGTWDILLTQYCNGTRTHPVWAIGELDFEDNNDPELLTECLTTLYVKAKTKIQVLQALRQGKMYATRNFAYQFLNVVDFSIGKKARVISGERLITKNDPQVHIIIDVLKTGNFTLQLIRNGKITRTFQTKEVGSWKINFFDTALVKNKQYYYRFLIYNNDWPILATNPIFVQKK